MKVYSGIGSRETPEHVLRLFWETALILGRQGWTLRSGGAPGADSAFEGGAQQARSEGGPAPELYLPWPRFGGRTEIGGGLPEPEPWTFPIAALFHPAWSRCDEVGRQLHARNVHQNLGRTKDGGPLSRFVLCWTWGGSGTGGTGQAIRIATWKRIPVYDLGELDTMSWTSDDVLRLIAPSLAG